MSYRTGHWNRAMQGDVTPPTTHKRGRSMLSWDTDERSASLYTRIYMFGMEVARDKQAFEGVQHTLRTARKLQRKGNAQPTPWTRIATRVKTGTVAGMTVWTVSPRRRRPSARVVYIHG